MSMADQKLWGGRFNEPTDAFTERFTASIEFDLRLYQQDIQGSIAHASMLGQQGILTTEEVQLIVSGLNEIKDEIEAGNFEWSVSLEDVHMNIESALTKKIGDVGKKLHTGRSRNDQVATDVRLWLRSQIDLCLKEIHRFQVGLATLASQEADTIMPGFTHLQTAQPVTFGHHMMAWYEMLKRDASRLEDARERLNQCPLGAAAMAGTTFPIDREATTKALGFSQPCLNSLDAVSDRDFAIEFSSCAAICIMHLTRMAEELVLWASPLVNFIDLPDRFCTGSSIMPQKKNPDVPELVRGKSGRIYGNLMSLLTLMKSQALAYNKDNQEDKEPLFDSADQLLDCLRAFADMIPAMKPNRDQLRKAAIQGYSTATDLADYLVRKGIPFRDAHEVVGKSVALAINLNCDLADLTLEQLQGLSTIIESDVYDCLTLEGSVNARDHVGGTAPAQVRAQAERALKALQ